MNSIKLKSLSLKNDFSPLLKLAIPLIITTVVQSSVNFLGNIFLAHLSEQAFAAGALVRKIHDSVYSPLLLASGVLLYPLDIS